jgi:glutamate-1-semialdehyde 2,1-aminomutase
MNRQVLWETVVSEYERRTSKSKAHYEQAARRQVRGGSHNLRLFEPYPFYDVSCSGARVRDLDGNEYVDFWQGHFANILGHNPSEITDVLAREFGRAQGLHTGFASALQSELAGELCRLAGAERIRFTTSGSLVTLYAVMLSRGFTGRNLALKIAGGWHGSQPYLLKGITAYQNGGLKTGESAGLHPSCPDEIVTTRLNNLANLEQTFRQFGDRAACFIMEPFIGEGGFLFADPQYLRRVRELTTQYGAVLVFDEIISGFRFHPGPLSALYGVTPDLWAFGKIIGGGMPITALAGKAEIMELCNPNAGARRVRFEGGTFSAHPATLLAGLTMVRILCEKRAEIYPKINRLGQKVRDSVPAIFQRFGLRATCTGIPSQAIPGSSMAMIQFPKEGREVMTPEDNWNSEVCDPEMREKIMRVGLVARGFHTVHGFGGVSFAHTDADIDRFLDAVEDFARLMGKMRDR